MRDRRTIISAAVQLQGCSIIFFWAATKTVWQVVAKKCQCGFRRSLKQDSRLGVMKLITFTRNSRGFEVAAARDDNTDR